VPTTVTCLALTYRLVEDYLERREPLREEHLGLARSAQERGDLLLGGAFADPADTALLIWSGGAREAIDRFVEQDPYVRHGLVADWSVRPWNVVVGTLADALP
jgi:uncharacterized protein YciI